MVHATANSLKKNIRLKHLFWGKGKYKKRIAPMISAWAKNGRRTFITGFCTCSEKKGNDVQTIDGIEEKKSFNLFPMRYSYCNNYRNFQLFLFYFFFFYSLGDIFSVFLLLHIIDLLIYNEKRNFTNWNISAICKILAKAVWPRIRLANRSLFD